MTLALTRQHWLKRFDPWLLLLSLVIACGGMVAIHSAKSAPGSISPFVIRQFVGVVLGLGAFTFMSHTDYRAVMTSARTLYLVNLALLTLVMLPLPYITHNALGAQRWINIGPLNLQPSEVAKVILILTLGDFLERNRDDIDLWPTLLRSLFHVALPMLLIFKQPDLGTSLVLMAVWFAMVFIAGARLRHLFLVTILGLCLFSAAWFAGAIKPFQKERLIGFVNGSVYHVDQARVAIGSGQVFGKGLFQGDMKRLKYVPEQHTDFIFTVVGEETGFVGSVILLGLYLLLILRILLAIWYSEDALGQVMATGVAAMFSFHVVENIGMTIGVMPVAGVPLPLFSYGPSAIIASLAALGLVESVYLRRHKISF